MCAWEMLPLVKLEAALSVRHRDWTKVSVFEVIGSDFLAQQNLFG